MKGYDFDVALKYANGDREFAIEIVAYWHDLLKTLDELLSRSGDQRSEDLIQSAIHRAVSVGGMAGADELSGQCAVLNELIQISIPISEQQLQELHSACKLALIECESLLR